MLAREGFEVTGFDGSHEAVAHTCQWLEKEQLNATITCEDMHRYAYGTECWDAVLSVNAAHHGIENQVRNTIDAIRTSLVPRGLLLVVAPRLMDRAQYGKRIGHRVFLPQEGPESGIPHVLFSRTLIHRLFPGFTIESLSTNPLRHYVILASKRE